MKKLTIDQKIYFYRYFKKRKEVNEVMISRLMNEVNILKKDNQMFKSCMKVYAKDVPNYLLEIDNSNIIF